MVEIKCPNCGTIMQESDGRHETINPKDYNGTGYLVAKEIRNENITNKKENKPMNNTTINNSMNNVNNSNNGGMNMEGFNMNDLAKVVAQMIKSDVNDAVNNSAPINAPTVDGGQWAKTSKFYGKEFCGYAFNPYLDRRFVPVRFTKLVARYGEHNVNQGIRENYGYMWSINYIKEECEKLIMLSKRDKIAYDERKNFWTPYDMSSIFSQYCRDAINYINKRLARANSKYGTVKIKGAGYYKFTETKVIENNKIVTKRKFVNCSLIERYNETINGLRYARTYKQIKAIMDKAPTVCIPDEYVEINRWNRETYQLESLGFKRYYKKGMYGYRINKEFLEGFKKSGAYYTMMDAIKFKGHSFKGLTGRDAVDLLKSFVNQPSFIIYAMYKEMCEDNN